MKQVSQDLRSGELRVEEVPVPVPRNGEVLVRVHASLVSPGTERAATMTARKSLLGKALDRPDDVRRVVEKVRREGLAAAYRAASARLDAPLALGYSAAGVVVALGDGVDDLSIGDPVACAGQGYASHAEWISVPRNLCALVPRYGGQPVAYERAAFATLGAIALHGIRQADARIGETVAVVGLGLVGNLTARLLLAAGCRVLGIEPDEHRRRLVPCEAFAPGDADDRVRLSTAGVGVDAVIVTASSAAAEVLESAARLCRDRGRVVVVGAVPIQVSRDLLFRREIDLRVSRSYGPGRYDPRYEEAGIDYPIGYVRWTERRNLEAFLEVDRDDRLGLGTLITHRFPIDRAAESYDLLIDGREPSLAVLLEYPGAKTDRAELDTALRRLPMRPAAAARFGVAFVGAGGFAQTVLLPAVRAERDVALRVVATRTGLSAKHVAKRFAFERAATDPGAVFDDPDVDVVFIAGPHSTHGAQVAAALKAGKHVFTEKPLCLLHAELDAIADVARSVPDAVLMVGFNRRFAPAAEAARRHFGASGPETVAIRVNAGPPAVSGWQAEREREGGRILGEVCHFVDLLTYFFAAVPVRVHATRPTAPGASPDDVFATIEFEGGRLGNVLYVTSGSSRLAKERIELFGCARSAVIDDFRTLELYDQRRRRRGSRWSKQDKGHAAEVAAFFASLRGERPSPISLRELSAVTRTTFAVEESLRRAQSITL